ncbi:MAG: hypothetical protein GY869_03385, partial [Planctomycetes bacterium]|nr:hypothetical protein [Planctomycetota bacterium]
DGVHVDPIAVKMALQCKGRDKLCLITDANIGAGSGVGKYNFGSEKVQIAYPGAPARLIKNGGLAGSGAGIGGGSWTDTLLNKLVSNTPDIVYQAAAVGGVGLAGYTAVKTAPAIAGTIKAGGSVLNRSSKMVQSVATRVAPKTAVKPFAQKAAASAFRAPVVSGTVRKAATNVGARVVEGTVLKTGVKKVATSTALTTLKSQGTKTLLRTGAVKLGAKAIPVVGTAYMVADAGAMVYESITGKDVGGKWLGMSRPDYKIGKVSDKTKSVFKSAGTSGDEVKQLYAKGMSPAEVGLMLHKRRQGAA